jgi:PTS system nitrogen regulatory IIA component
MSQEEDFDIDRLAAFLHIAPAQVLRLANRGDLPGRKVGGQWRFSVAEVHHWLEQRIGLADDNQLAQVEDVLQRAAHDEQQRSILEMLPPEAMAVPLPSRTRHSVIHDMCQLAAQTGWLWDVDKLADAVRRREEMHPTALENGVALLHPRRPMPSILAQPFLAFGRTAQGIPFGGSRGVLTDVFFLILSTDDRVHLRTLARLSRIVNDPATLAEIRSAADAESVREAIARREAQLDA